MRERSTALIRGASATQSRRPRRIVQEALEKLCGSGLPRQAPQHEGNCGSNVSAPRRWQLQRRIPSPVALGDTLSPWERVGSAASL